MDPRGARVKESLDRVSSEFAVIFLRRRGEPCVEVRVLRERQTFPRILEPAEVPQDFLQSRTFPEHLWPWESDVASERTRQAPCLRFTTVGLLSGRDLWRRNSTVVVGSDSSGWILVLECDEAEVRGPLLL